MKAAPVAVIGKTSKTGRRVNSHLAALGHPTRPLSRSSSIPFDWEVPDTWPAALEGARAAYVTFYPDLAVPHAQTSIAAFIEVARRAGVEHVVLLSGRGEPGAEKAEALLQSSGLDWNVVRASWFMQNFSEGFLVEGVLSGELMLPVGHSPEPFIDVDDIAQVAVAALTRPALRNRLFEVSGPRSMTFAQCAAEISAATGYSIELKSIPVEAFVAGLRQQGLPPSMVDLMRELFTVVLDGRNATPANGVFEALGRPATDFATYVQRTAGSGAWQRGAMTFARTASGL
ncbi:MAG: NmrA family transcriptional regulator [Pseudomonadota bacterium]